MLGSMELPEVQWQEYFERRMDLIKSVMGAKRQEYAGGYDDRLHNFNRAVELHPFTNSRERIMFDFMFKHWISLTDMLDGLQKDKVPTRALVEEKFGDIINYLLLMEASILQTVTESERRQTRSLIPIVDKNGYTSFISH